MNKSTWKACAGAVFVNIMWGLSFIASKVAMNQGFEPFSLILVRYVLATVLLFPFLLQKEGLHFSRKLLWPMLLCTLTGSSLYFFFEYNGLKYTNASTASLIVAGIPILQLIWDVIRHKKRYRVNTWLGVACSIAGVYLLVAYGVEGGGSLPGYLYMAGACVCWVAYHEVTDGLLQEHSTLMITWWSSLFAVITLIPGAAMEGIAWSRIAPMAWLAAAFLGIVCSALCYLIYNTCIHRLSPARTALFLNLNPVAGCLGGVLMLGERLTAAQLIGGLVILGSLLWVNRTIERATREQE